MTTSELRRAVTTTPFTPFKVVMADGTRYRVPSPEWIAYPQPTRLCTIAQPDGTFAVLHLLTMTGLEYESDPTPPTGGEGEAQPASAA